LKDFIKCPSIINDVRSEDEGKGIYLVIELFFCIAFYFIIEELWKYFAKEFLLSFINGLAGKVTKGQVEKGYLIYVFLYVTKFLLYMAIILFVRGRRLSTLGLGFGGIKPKGLALSFVYGITGLSLAVFICVARGALSVGRVESNMTFLSFLTILLQIIVYTACVELFFRGFLFTTIVKRYSILFSIVTSSIIFAILQFYEHAEKIRLNDLGIDKLITNIRTTSFLNLFLLGVFTCLLFLYTEKLWAVIIFHTAWIFTESYIYGITSRGPVLELRGYSLSFCKSVITSKAEYSNMVGRLKVGLGLEEGWAVTIVLLIGIVLLFYMQLDKE